MEEYVEKKVIVLHHLKLPTEMINEICGFCFYDKEISFHRKNKKNMLSGFKNNLISGHDLQHWWFWMSQPHDVQFQSIFCSECGNYIMSNNYQHIANKSICECI